MSDSKHDQKIRERAYHIWEAEGRPHGRHDQHWQDALRDVAASATDAIASVKTNVQKVAGKVVAAISEATSPKPTPPAPKARKTKLHATTVRKPRSSRAAAAAETSTSVVDKPVVSKKPAAPKTQRAASTKAVQPPKEP
jgi:hypothetical protein